jgi:ABC-type multidrug transport system ATPase subunit
MFMDETSEADSRAPALANEPVVAVEGLAGRYGRRVAVQGLSFTLRAGEVFGLVGANGGGKTTTLRILAGILKPYQGLGRVLGFDLVRDAGKIRERIGYMSQRFSLYGDLSVLENLRFRASVYGLKRPREAAEIAIDSFELREYARSPVGQLSGGWTRRLQLAAALIHSPKLVLLDEPTAGLDALSRQQVWRHIGRLAADGVGVVVSTHDLAEAERCSHAALLADGCVLAIGTLDQIARSVPAVAFLISGATARLMTLSVEAIPGVIATYPQGPNLRVVAAASAEKNLLRVATLHQGGVARVAMRLEDTVLAFSGRS